MSKQESNVQFEAMQPVSRSNARVAVKQGLIDITVTGQAEAVEAYLNSALIKIDILPPEEFQKNAEQFTGGNKQQDEYITPVHPSKILTIEIKVVETKIDTFTLILDIDPDVPAGYAHRYELSGYTEVAAKCTTVSGNPTLRLRERNDTEWPIRAPGRQTNPLTDEIETVKKQFEGTWRLHIYEANGNAFTYNLFGIFLNDKPERFNDDDV